MCTEILGTESIESWSKEGESHHVSREGTERLSTSKPSVTSKNHSSPSAALVPPLLRSISGPSAIRLTPRRERGWLILEAVPCLIHHVQAEKNDIGGLALEAVLSFFLIFKPGETMAGFDYLCLALLHITTMTTKSKKQVMGRR
ncbi:hypothetical protein OIU84_015426 [Salix udensis]|uniref:Uncharacterized protein n=1 Tax=Salix udensis TaxID=889485 RepID=A0AAD6NSK8_9ROSI|nr:hypothetical protein OIU84_015426 [Salix udensis]